MKKKQGTEKNERYCLYEEKGENPGSIKELWSYPESNKPVIIYRIEFPSKDNITQNEEEKQ
jgi:hypothetical protein